MNMDVGNSTENQTACGFLLKSLNVYTTSYHKKENKAKTCKNKFLLWLLQTLKNNLKDRNYKKKTLLITRKGPN